MIVLQGKEFRNYNAKKHTGQIKGWKEEGFGLTSLDEKNTEICF